tara:strand:+ start:4904 stop:5473 length:570 start_codon:yes stop_codon:yes gene_type:complete
MKLINTLLFTAVCAATSIQTCAKTYMGLDVGEHTQTQVEQVFAEAKASYDTGYGYKGYSELGMFKVSSYSGFDKYGTVKSAWLYFTPDKQLYKLEVTYGDAGSTHTLFSDALSSKYKLIGNNSRGFNSSQVYADDDVHITLARNAFGFGNDQKTILTYEFQPAISEVHVMEQLIEKAIAKKNANKAGDL